VPELADELGQALLRSVEGIGKLPGHTAVCIDISGSMNTPISEKSKTTRAEAGAALGVLAREICEQATVLVFGTTVAKVANIRGMGMVEAIRRANETDMVGSGTNIGGAVSAARDLGADRIIVVTDEQGHSVPEGSWKGYLMNVAPYAPALILDKNVTRISGFSERIFDFISFEETGRTLASAEEENVEHD
jgi:60 kDa SS-A/Ro ribonucleoprotein